MTHWLGRGGKLAPPARNAFGVISIETTGLFPAYHDRIIEIAVVNVDGDRVTDEWVTLVNPERDIGPTRVHGISARQVVAAPTFQLIAGDLVERLADRVLVGHNGRFQGDFIEYELGRLGHRVDCTQILCTMTLAQGLGISGRSLHACCESLGLATRFWRPSGRTPSISRSTKAIRTSSAPSVLRASDSPPIRSWR